MLKIWFWFIKFKDVKLFLSLFWNEITAAPTQYEKKKSGKSHSSFTWKILIFFLFELKRQL